MATAWHSRCTLLACIRSTALLLALICALLGAPTVRGGVAGSWQTVTGNGGFQLQIPNSWGLRPDGGTATTLKAMYASPDGQERVNVYVASQMIASTDLPLFVSTYAGNAALGAANIGQTQAATVPGAVAAATITATYTDGGGARVSDTILAAVTGSQLYVLDIVTPASSAPANAGQVQTIVESFAIVAS